MSQSIIDTVATSHDISQEQLSVLLHTDDMMLVQTLFAMARQTTQRSYGNKVFMRGLIEISNHCRNNCLYCGIRRDQSGLQRYRLSKEQILQCCAAGHQLGFRTFVLQGGEDAWFDDDRLCDIVSDVHAHFPDCAITLSLGERGRSSFQRLFDAGAERYLLRHETASPMHYAQLHPAEMSFDNRMRCLDDLKAIGYQVGCGFMVGSPYQTDASLWADLQFLRRFQPQMVGIGPFIPASGTPFAGHPAGSVDLTLRLLSIIRLILPSVLLPATTALGTLSPNGREMGIMAGANVVMPNLSPQGFRAQYSIYDNKLASGSEAAECANDIRSRLNGLDRDASPDRGDFRP